MRDKYSFINTPVLAPQKVTINGKEHDFPNEDFRCLYVALISDNRDYQEEIQKLQEENKLLSECVEFYADNSPEALLRKSLIKYDSTKIARETLEKIISNKTK